MPGLKPFYIILGIKTGNSRATMKTEMNNLFFAQ
jgi:hypothetical protein